MDVFSVSFEVFLAALLIEWVGKALIKSFFEQKEILINKALDRVTEGE